MIANDLSNLEANNWLISYIYVDNPSNLLKIRDTFDKELSAINDKIKGCFFLCYINLADKKHLTSHHYKLYLWKKNETTYEELKAFVKNQTTSLKNFLHANENNPKFEQKEDSKSDNYENISDLYLGCVSNKIRLLIQDNFGKDLKEDAMFMVLHFLFNEILKQGYIYDLNVGAKLVMNALNGLGINPQVHKD